MLVPHEYSARRQRGSGGCCAGVVATGVPSGFVHPPPHRGLLRLERSFRVTRGRCRRGGREGRRRRRRRRRRGRERRIFQSRSPPRWAAGDVTTPRQTGGNRRGGGHVWQQAAAAEQRGLVVGEGGEGLGGVDGHYIDADGSPRVALRGAKGRVSKAAAVRGGERGLWKEEGSRRRKNPGNVSKDEL